MLMKKTDLLKMNAWLRKTDYAMIGTKADQTAPEMFPAFLLAAANPPKIQLSGRIVGARGRGRVHGNRRYRPRLRRNAGFQPALSRQDGGATFELEQQPTGTDKRKKGE